MPIEESIEALVTRGATFEVLLDRETLSSIADLVLRLGQQEARRAGAILPSHMQRTFNERTEAEREGMRSAVANVVRALALVGIIDAHEV